MEFMQGLVGIGVVILIILFLRSKTEETLRPPDSRRQTAATGDEAVIELMRQGRKIDAVKAYRRTQSAGLKEAVEAVERLAEEAGV